MSEPHIYRGVRPTFRLPRASAPQSLRQAFGRFPTGVCVVSFDGPDGKHGLTVNSFTSVSLDPPLILVSIGKKTRSHDMLINQPFTVSVLGVEQEDLARHFAGRPNVEPVWREGEYAPRLANTLAHFECTPWNNYDGGDHTLILGEVRDWGYRRGDALGFNGSSFTTIREHEAGPEFLL